MSILLSWSSWATRFSCRAMVQIAYQFGSSEARFDGGSNDADARNISELDTASPSQSHFAMKKLIHSFFFDLAQSLEQ